MVRALPLVALVGRLRPRSWETPEDERRSVVEIEADEVGASLKFVQASFHKPRRDSGTGKGGQFDDEPPFQPQL